MKSFRVIFTILILFFSTGVFLLNSCSDDSNPSAPNPPITQNLIKLDSQYAIGARASVSFYVEESLKVGYNNVYIVLYDSLTKALITDAHVTFEIVNHGVGAPVENPPETPVDGKFKGAMILTAPQSGDMPHWHYHIHVHNHQAPGEPEGAAEFGDFVVRDNPDKFKSITMPDSTKLFISYIQPKNPVTGTNNFEVLINKNEPQLFPPDGTYTIVVNPVYLSSGNSSSNNVNPVGSSNGHYVGSINLAQSGAWRINLRLEKNSIHYNTYFEISY